MSVKKCSTHSKSHKKRLQYTKARNTLQEHDAQSVVLSLKLAGQVLVNSSELLKPFVFFLPFIRIVNSCISFF